MATEINKTSIAYTVSEFLDNLEKWVLDPTEAINESPSSFTALLSSTLGKISAYSYFNMLMSKREITPSTAILMKSLMRQLNSDSISDIYGTPSSLRLIVSYPEQDILQAAVADGTGKYKCTLNKGTTFKLGNYPVFTLDYNIDIYITKYNSSSGNSTSIYAMYDIDDKEAGDIITCTNPYITSRNDVVIENKKHFTMYIDIKQYERNYSINEMSGEATNITIDYNNSLMGFVVLYKAQGYTDYYKIPVYLEGESFTYGMSYSLNEANGTKTLQLKFSKLPDAFNPTNGILKIVYYTTEGETGNFELGQVDENTLSDLTMTYSQDVSDEYQEALINLIPTISIASTSATGGADAKDLEGVREVVANAGNGEVITPAKIDTAATKRGFTAYKERHDLLSFEYMLTSFLKYDGNIIPSKMIDGFYNFSDIEVDGESDSRMITPADVFRYDETSQKYKYIAAADLETYSEFYENYESGTITDYSFPYFIRIQNGDSMSIDVYDESINESKSTMFTYLADSVLDKASIINLDIFRNPLSKDTVTYENLQPILAKDAYRFKFTVNTSSAIVSHLQELYSSEAAYAKFRLIFKDTTDSAVYSADVDLGDCVFNSSSIICSCYLKTNSSVLSSGKIKITDNSLKSLPYTSTQYSFYYIDGVVDVDICVIFKELEDGATRQSSKFDSYLTDSEITNGYYIGVIYSAENVELAKNMGDNISLNSDIKLKQPEYQVAEEDIPDVYSENVYKMDGDEYVMEDQVTTLPDGSTSTISTYVLLHSAGETKKSLNGCVGTYNTLGTSKTWKWSKSDKSDDEIYNEGDVLGGNSIYAAVQWNELVIFGGEDGRIGCYDSQTNKWFAYNSTEAYRGSDDSSGYVITSTGEPLGNSAVRGMLVVTVGGNDILFVYGDNGRIATCDLSSNTWKYYDGSGGNSTAIYYNNGAGLGAETAYTAITYKNSSNETVIVFGGGSGRMCSLVIETNAWYLYNYDTTKRSKDYMFSDGSERDYKAILSMNKYLESAIYCTGVNGICSVMDLTSGEVTLLSDGSVVDGSTMYSSTVYGNLFIIAGKSGIVASYNIVKSSWNQYNAGSGLCSDGVYMNYENIYAILVYGVNIMFCGGLGYISSYDFTSSAWESYSDGSGLSNDGSFIDNAISCVTYDTVEGNSVIYFGGSTGNVSYKYRKGDIMYDSNGNPIVKSGSTQIGYVKGIPAYSRVYAIDSVYNGINEAYDEIIEKISEMSTIFVDGCSLHFGLKTTSGSSSTFYYVDPDSSEKVYLNNLCISLGIGVKFEDNITSDNQSYLIDQINSAIVQYIEDIQTSTDSNTITFNINTMLDSVKTSVPGISYFEYYWLNDYDSSECQTIFCERSSDSDDNEYLSIESLIDESSSDIENGSAVFEPNIDITVL